MLDAYARAAECALFEVVLHRLRPQDLALAHTMGFEPGPITVAPDGLVIGFVPRGGSLTDPAQSPHKAVTAEL